jgi:hypothetical protein
LRFWSSFFFDISFYGRPVLVMHLCVGNHVNNQQQRCSSVRGFMCGQVTESSELASTQYQRRGPWERDAKRGNMVQSVRGLWRGCEVARLWCGEAVKPRECNVVRLQ